ncbi:MAG: glycosyltransferase family 61 protein [Hymenobacter sp.]
MVKGLRVFVPSLPYSFLEPELSGTFLLRQLKSRRNAELTGPVGLVFDQWSIGNYFHWIAEVLPRLALLRKFQPDCIVLLPGPNPSAFITQTVAAFGFERTYIMSPGEMLQIPDLLVAALPGFQGYITPSLVRESRDTILAKLVPHTLAGKKASRKVYVSRSLQKWRQLTNESKVVAMLTRYGFETVYFEHLSFIEQISLMRETKVFIGIHGANMTNIFFMPAGGYVIEMLSEGYTNISYLHMANSVGLEYAIAPSTVGSPPEVFNSYADITTDVRLVEEIIQPICEAIAQDTSQGYSSEPNT